MVQRNSHFLEIILQHTVIIVKKLDLEAARTAKDRCLRFSTSHTIGSGGKCELAAIQREFCETIKADIDHRKRGYIK